jgi:cytidylate kinase
MRIVTIARSFGAGGHTVGIELSKRLGFELVEEEVLNAVAKKAKVSPGWVKAIEKERGNQLMNFINSLVSISYIDQLQKEKNRGYLDEKIYVDTLQEVMLEMTREADTIIVGRGGQYFLKDHPQAVHVLLTANKAFRIKFLQEYYDMNKERARELILRGDKRRQNFYKKIHHKDYNSNSLYTVVLNMTKISVDKAVNIIEDLVEGL